jgi:hypothetical protein
MKTNIPYKKRLTWLGLGYAVIIIFCLRFPIQKTIREQQLYHKNISQISLSRQSNDQSKDLKTKETTLTAILLKFKLDTLHRENSLLSVTSDYCNEHGLILKEYRPFSKSGKDSIDMLTRVVTIEASFIDCIKLIKDFETSKNVGRVCSVNFKSFTDPQDKKVKLNCTIFIQNANIHIHEIN